MRDSYPISLSIPLTIRSSSSTSRPPPASRYARTSPFVVRDHVIRARVEPVPHGLADVPEIPQDRVAVVDLVGGGHTEARRRQRAGVFDVLHLAFDPGRFGVSHESVQSSTMRATASPKRSGCRRAAGGRPDPRRHRAAARRSPRPRCRRRRGRSTRHPSGGRVGRAVALAHLRGVDSWA